MDLALVWLLIQVSNIINDVDILVHTAFTLLF